MLADSVEIVVMSICYHQAWDLPNFSLNFERIDISIFGAWSYLRAYTGIDALLWQSFARHVSTCTVTVRAVHTRALQLQCIQWMNSANSRLRFTPMLASSSPDLWSTALSSVPVMHCRTSRLRVYRFRLRQHIDWISCARVNGCMSGWVDASLTVVQFPSESRRWSLWPSGSAQQQWVGQPRFAIQMHIDACMHARHTCHIRI